MPKERLQSILGSNISLNDENKKKLTNILEVPNIADDEITVDEITIEVPNSEVEATIIQRLMACFTSVSWGSKQNDRLIYWLKLRDITIKD